MICESCKTYFNKKAIIIKVQRKVDKEKVNLAEIYLCDECASNPFLITNLVVQTIEKTIKNQ